MSTCERDSNNFENSVFTYNPSICISYDSNDEIDFILFIKQLRWTEMLSESCGCMYDYDSEGVPMFDIYIGQSLDNIIEYAMDNDERKLYCC